MSWFLKDVAMLRIIVKRMTAMPRAMATTNTVFKRPTNGRSVMASVGRSHRAGITSSNPNTLPNRNPKIVEKKPQQEMMAARLIFLNL